MSLYDLKILDITKDIRTNAWVVYGKIPMNQYLNWLGEDFHSSLFQRNREKHKSYEKLKEDIKAGTTLPSVILAVKPSLVKDSVDTDFLKTPGNLLILDGLQRTFIIDEITKEQHHFPENYYLPVEIWLEKDINKLIYRFIILNAGRKSVTLEHQLDLLFRNIKEDLLSKIEILKIIDSKDKKQEDEAGAYQFSFLVTSFYCFLTQHYSVKSKLNLVAQQMSEEKALNLAEKKWGDLYSIFKIFLPIYIELDRKLIRESGNNWFQTEAVMNAFWGAMGQHMMFTGRQNHLTNESVISVAPALKILYSSSEKLKDMLFLDEYEQVITGFPSSKYSIGQVQRKLIFEVFRYFFMTKDENTFQSWANFAKSI